MLDWHEYLLEQLNCLIRRRLRAVPVQLLNVVSRHGWVFRIKRQGSLEHSIEGDSQTPDISEFAIVPSFLDDFRRSVGRRPTESLHPLFISTFQVVFGQSKVDQFGVHVVVENNVLSLDVPVGYPHRVEIFDSRKYLGEDLSCHFVR